MGLFNYVTAFWNFSFQYLSLFFSVSLITVQKEGEVSSQKSAAEVHANVHADVS